MLGGWIILPDPEVFRVMLANLVWTTNQWQSWLIVNWMRINHLVKWHRKSISKTYGGGVIFVT